MIKKTLKIRHYVMGLMYRAGASSVQIASARDLAKRFDIACSTVALALKELTDEGYIHSRPGIGNFTNPLRLTSDPARKMPPLVGVMFGDGRFYYIEPTLWETWKALGDALFTTGFNMRIIELHGPVDAESADDILENKVDALLWLGAYKQKAFAKRLLASGLPVVSDSPFLDGIDSVTPDNEVPMNALLDHAEELGVEGILLYQPPEIAELDALLLKKLAAARHVRISISSIDPTSLKGEDDLEKRLGGIAGRTLALVNAVSCQTTPLGERARRAGKELFFHKRNSGALDGKPATFIRGARFAQTMAERLREKLAGDQSIKHLQAPLELVADLACKA